ncbi:MAG TPA: helix-turn-helix domain-containing protein, partial [Candidatus Acidoferrum sp.]|nr:helix-turn-helix domain-containing protein [Candidatus Acidoferrum sp.]
DDGIMIDTRLTHDDIAAWVGMARETVSHQIEKLTKDHIITTSQHRVTIRDLGRLRDLAS